MKKITISKRMVFEAAHFLPAHPGKCANLHGHSFSVVVGISKSVSHQESLTNGMVMDYADLKQIMERRITNLFDHSYLNERFYDPTSEIIAFSIFDDLKSLLPEGICLEYVIIKETENSECKVEEIEDGNS